MRRLPSAIAAGLLAAASLCLFAPEAAAAEGSLVVRSLDATAPPNVTAILQYTGPLTSAVTGVTVRENGRLVSDVDVVPMSESQVPVGVVIVLDTSGSMRTNGRMDAAKEAIRKFVAGRNGPEQIALVGFSDEPRVLHSFSADVGAALAADPLVPSGETALWDAIRAAIGLFGAQGGGLQPNVLVLSDGNDSVSKTNAADVRGAALAAHVPISTIGLTGEGFDGGALQSLSDATGGRFLATTNPAELDGLFDQIRRDLNQQFQVTWKSSAVSPDVTFQLQGAVAGGVVPSGGESHGSSTSPRVVNKGGGILGGTVGRLLTLGLAAAAGVGLALSGCMLYLGKGTSLRHRLASYGANDPDAPPAAKAKQVASTEVVQRAIAWTADAGKGLGLFGWIERRLEIARLPLRAAEAAFFTLAFALVAGLAVGALKGPVVGFVFMVAAIGGAAFALSFLAKRTTKKFVKQLPGALQLLASSLRAGYSLLQGVDSVSNEIGGPLGAELRRSLAEARLGRPIEDALERSAERVGSADYAWVVMAIGIQREVGGNLAELLDTVAETMRARVRLRGEVKALTAEGRASAIMLGIMPPALGAAMAVMSKGYLDPLFTDPVGRIMFGGCVLSVIAGFIWMQKIVKVEL